MRSSNLMFIAGLILILLTDTIWGIQLKQYLNKKWQILLYGLHTLLSSMKISQNISFSKQLIIYLILVLFFVFFLISLILFNSLEQFINNNAYRQSKAIVNNTLINLEREITRVESIPQNVTDMQGELNYTNIPDLPGLILKSDKTLVGSSIHYDPKNPEVADFIHINAYRTADGKIHFSQPNPCCNYCHLDSAAIIKSTPHNGYWIYSEVNHCKTIALCHLILNNQHQSCGVLKVDFPLKNLNALLNSYRLFRSGNLFVVDRAGNYIAYPASSPGGKQNLISHLTGPKVNFIQQSMLRGETYATTVDLDEQKHYLYYTPLSSMGWQIGIISPYSDILYSSGKLYFMLFLSLGVGLLCLFIGIVKIVKRLSTPLLELTYSTRRIAEGQLDIALPSLKSCKEIYDLYDSFHHLQQNLINYIERLKITMTEKEQYNSEMRLAHRIQQHFLPRPIHLPSNIELAADLRQCHEVGGDFYEYFQQGDKLYFAIGDVAGKGIPAALYMTSISKLFRCIASNNTSTAQICNLINKHICNDANDDIYTTIFIGIIDINTGIMTFTNAGHPYPLIIHHNEQISFLNQFSDTPIGVLKDHEFSEDIYTFSKNTTLLFYTDGITDTENQTGQFYGQNKMIRCVEAQTVKTPAFIIQALLKDIHSHIGQGNPSDDLSLLAIKYKGIPESK